MAQFDFFGVFDFKTGDDDTYKYTSTEFVKMYRAMTNNGVVKGEGNELAVSLNGLSVNVATGGIYIEGRYAEATTPKALTISTTGTAYVGRVVAKLDVVARTITLEFKQGGATAPALTQNDTVWEVSLAQINVPAGGVSTTLVDERNFFYKPSQVMEKMNAITGGTDYVYAVYA